MKFISFFIALVLVVYPSCADPGCPDMDAYYWGYWGANLSETQLPNIIWDTENIAQLIMARDRGDVTVLFHLQNLLFDFDPQGLRYTLKKYWQQLFDNAYGNASNPMNPYNISGLYANAPHGFFLGSNLIYYGGYHMSPSNTYQVANYIRMKYPTALIAIDEWYHQFSIDVDYHNEIATPQFGDPFDLLFISGPRPAEGAVNGGVKSYEDYYGIYMSFIWHHLEDNIKIIFSQDAYSTKEQYIASSCYPPSGEDCNFVMKNNIQSRWKMFCLDRLGCPEAEGITMYSETPTGRIKGIVLWHWNDLPSMPGYEIGVRSNAALLHYEFLFGNKECISVLNEASNYVISISLLLSLIFLTLM